MKKLVTEADVVDASRKGVRALQVEEGTIVTPSARDAASRLGIRFVNESLPVQATPFTSVEVLRPSEKTAPHADTVVALGSDHGGFALKEQLKQYVLELGYSVADVGTHTEQPCDYPDFAFAVATMVSSGKASKGIMIDAVGAASAIVANKVQGIRAVAAASEFVARSSREHNDANVLTLGGRVLGIEAAKSILKVWLETWFGGGRHMARVKKISEIEERSSRRS